MAALQALSVGHALDLRAVGAGVVHSVFVHAVNLEIRGDLWTLIGAQRGDLPFGIRVAPVGFDGIGLRRGDAVHVKAGFLGIAARGDSLVVDCRAAPVWIPACPVAPAPGLAQRLSVVAAAAKPRAWSGAARLADAVVRAVHGPDALRDLLGGVVGCGPGSTPAGDDVLVGILAVLTSLHTGAKGAAAAALLHDAMHPLLATTTDLSAHLLRQAANGLFGRTVHDLVCTLSADTAPGPLHDAARRVVDTGATSGADMCMGLLASARAFLLTHHERAAA